MFEGMTAKQIAAYIQQAQDAYQQAFHQEQEVAGERQARIQEAIDTLTTLIGPENADPALDSIRGVLAFSDEEIADHPALAIRLILQGMEIMALTTRDLAETVA